MFATLKKAEDTVITTKDRILGTIV